LIVLVLSPVPSLLIKIKWRRLTLARGFNLSTSSPRSAHLRRLAAVTKYQATDRSYSAHRAAWRGPSNSGMPERVDTVRPWLLIPS
jgi:hypothetical protein